MFCPAIKSKCVREKCRDWVPEVGDCAVRLDRKLSSQILVQQCKLIDLEKFNAVWFKLAASNLLSDPNVPDEAKACLRQALQAPSAEVAEKLLRDVGLIKD